MSENNQERVIQLPPTNLYKLPNDEIVFLHTKVSSSDFEWGEVTRNFVRGIPYNIDVVNNLQRLCDSLSIILGLVKLPKDSIRIQRCLDTKGVIIDDDFSYEDQDPFFKGLAIEFTIKPPFYSPDMAKLLSGAVSKYPFLTLSYHHDKGHFFRFLYGDK